MINSTTIQNMDEYASDVSAEILVPTAEQYAEGAKNGWTAPAGWWNYLFQQLTIRVGQERADVTTIIEEIKAVLTEASITPSGANNAQLKAAVLSILQRMASSASPGMVKSSNANGKVQVLSDSGIMEVNGIGNFADLPPALSSAYTLVDAIDIIYEQLQRMSIGVPPQPSSYDTDSPVLDTTTLSGDDADFGSVDLDAGWYFVDMSGGGGGGWSGGSNTHYQGGCGTRSTGWIFVMSPGKYLYGVGDHGGNWNGDWDFDPSIGQAGVCGLSQVLATSHSYFDGLSGTAAGTNKGGTGGASVLISCPTQEVYCVSGGSGGAFGVQNYVNLVSAEAYVDQHTEDGISYYGAYAQSESVPASGQMPWGVNGWAKGPGAHGGYSFVNTHGNWSMLTPQKGWVKIFRGVTAAPST